MQQDISFSYLCKNILARHDPGYRLGGIGAETKLVMPFNVIHLHEKGQIQRAGDAIDRLLHNVKLVFQNSHQPRIDLLIYLQANDLAPLPFLQLFLNLREQILCLILVDGQICIPHDPVRTGTDHVIV